MQKFETKELSGLRPGWLLIDTRKSEAFADGFIPGSISIPFDENFLPVFDELMDPEQQILMVTEQSELPELLKVIKSSGLTNVHGYLDGGIIAWREAGNKADILITIDADELAMDYKFDEFLLLDIRPKEAFEAEHVQDAENIALDDLGPILAEMDSNSSYYIYGNSSSAVTAASLFRRNGFHRVRAVTAGFDAIKATGIPIYMEKKKRSTSNDFPLN